MRATLPEGQREGKEKCRRDSNTCEGRNRPMTMRECIEALITPHIFRDIESMKQEAKRGPLHRGQFKILEMLAKQGFPGAQELLDKRSQIGVKKRMRFAEIVKETPRLDGETDRAWIDRIFDACGKYETRIPGVIVIERLEKWSHGLKTESKTEWNNLPAIRSATAKSFRTAEGSLATPLK